MEASACVKVSKHAFLLDYKKFLPELRGIFVVYPNLGFQILMMLKLDV